MKMNDCFAKHMSERERPVTEVDLEILRPKFGSTGIPRMI